MKNLFDPSLVVEVRERLERLQPDSPRLWGKMTAPQALAHCSAGFEWALGDTRPTNIRGGREIGRAHV